MIRWEGEDDVLKAPFAGNFHQDEELLQRLFNLLLDEKSSMQRRISALRRIDVVMGLEKTTRPEEYTPEGVRAAVREARAMFT